MSNFVTKGIESRAFLLVCISVHDSVFVQQIQLTMNTILNSRLFFFMLPVQFRDRLHLAQITNWKGPCSDKFAPVLSTGSSEIDLCVAESRVDSSFSEEDRFVVAVADSCVTDAVFVSKLQWIDRVTAGFILFKEPFFFSIF